MVEDKKNCTGMLAIRAPVILLLTLGLVHVHARLNCTDIRLGFKCVARDVDSADKFTGTIRNIHSTDVKLDIMSVVDTCEEIFRRPSPRDGRSQARRNSTARGDQEGGGGGGWPRHMTSPTTVARRMSRDTKISRGGSMTLNMERVKAPGYCSKTIIKGCRAENNARMQCNRLIAIQ